MEITKKKCVLCNEKSDKRFWIKLNDPETGFFIKKLYFCSQACLVVFARNYSKVLQGIAEIRKEKNASDIKTDKQINR